MGAQSRGDSPISPATSWSSPEKTTPQSAKPPTSGLHSNTFICLTSSGIGVESFHFVTLAYSCPAERDDAPKAWILKYGCVERSWMNRCPTVPMVIRSGLAGQGGDLEGEGDVPVAPRIPTLISCLDPPAMMYDCWSMYCKKYGMWISGLFDSVVEIRNCRIQGQIG